MRTLIVVLLILLLLTSGTAAYFATRYERQQRDVANLSQALQWASTELKDAIEDRDKAQRGASENLDLAVRAAFWCHALDEEQNRELERLRRNRAILEPYFRAAEIQIRKEKP